MVPGSAFVMPMPTNYKAPEPEPPAKTASRAQGKPQMLKPAAKKEAPVDTSKLTMEQVMQRMEVNGQKKLE